MGCVLVPISPRNLNNKNEVIHMIKTALKATPGKAPVVIAADASTAAALDELSLLVDPIKIVTSTPEPFPGWLPFEKVMRSCSATNVTDRKQYPEDVGGGAVLFTSGTTSMPKGIFTQRSTHALFVESWERSRPHDGIFTGSRFCSVLPNNHSFAHYMIVCAQSIAAAIIYPGPGFEANSMLETLHREQVTQVRLYISFLLISIPFS
jgi:acyl-coenzyme A synthetase/AMP-(fatty) acid ligase